MDIYSIARPEIVAMKPYVSARNSAAADGVLLNANEAPMPHVDDAKWRRLELNRYPSPQPALLKLRMAELYGVPESNLLVTRGSDEGIDLLTRVFCRPYRDAIVECTPCFGMYKIAATVQGAEIIDVPRLAGQNFKIDFDQLEKIIGGNDNVRLVFLTTPNNPTGDVIDRANLERVLRVCEDKALVVLDEAYIEFCDSESACGWVSDWPHLVVLRTLSKAWAAAGVRCGTVIADPVVIGLLRRVIAPYPLAATAIDAALQGTDAEAAGRQREFIKSVRKNRTELQSFLRGCDWIKAHWESEANFILVQVGDAVGLVKWCASSGIRIRDFSTKPQLQGCVRLTIGSDADLVALKSALQAYGTHTTGGLK